MMARDDLVSVASVSTAALLEELARRNDAKPACGSKGRGEYNTGIHVFALVLVLVLSTGFCAIPLISHRGTPSRHQRNIIFLCQHFGTGVLLATAFVHLLPTAFTSLTDPCLPDFFSKNYKPVAGLVAMVAALSVVAVESYLTTRGAGHSHSHAHELWADDEFDDDAVDGHIEGGVLPSVESNGPTTRLHGQDAETEGLVAGVSPLPVSTPMRLSVDGRQSKVHGEDEDSDLELDIEELDPIEVREQARPLAGGSVPLQRRHHGSHSSHRHAKKDSLPHATTPPTAEEQQRLLIQCLLLEAGILFHSIFIGMAVSVATGSTFAVFLIAICFHQSFEGLALGSRIAAVQLPRNSLRPWFMVLAFGLTTPIGQLIGLLVHNLYDPLSQTGLIVVGLMNAISSGLLLFAGLVQLLAEDFLSEKSYKTLNGWRRWQAYLAVLGGAGLMATVGAFA